MRQNPNSFLPEGYEAPKGNSDYMKFEQGENKFRILSQPIVGWEDWEDKKPIRFPMNMKPEKPINPNQSIKFFWAMIVWNRKEEKIQILEITQRSVQSPIELLAKDSEWGNPFGYDIKVTKTGEKMDTEYSVNPSPQKKVEKEVIEAFKAKPCFLKALYQGADPFINHGEITPLNDVTL